MHGSRDLPSGVSSWEMTKPVNEYSIGYVINASFYVVCQCMNTAKAFRYHPQWSSVIESRNVSFGLCSYSLFLFLLYPWEGACTTSRSVRDLPRRCRRHWRSLPPWRWSLSHHHHRSVSVAELKNEKSALENKNLSKKFKVHSQSDPIPFWHWFSKYVRFFSTKQNIRSMHGILWNGTSKDSHRKNLCQLFYTQFTKHIK